MAKHLSVGFPLRRGVLVMKTGQWYSISFMKSEVGCIDCGGVVIQQ
mgnify:CR=1 FL=1